MADMIFFSNISTWYFIYILFHSIVAVIIIYMYIEILAHQFQADSIKQSYLVIILFFTEIVFWAEVTARGHP